MASEFTHDQFSVMQSCLASDAWLLLKAHFSEQRKSTVEIMMRPSTDTEALIHMRDIQAGRDEVMRWFRDNLTEASWSIEKEDD